jgi:hypothetical protein
MRRRKSKVEREANAPGNLPPVDFMDWWSVTGVHEPSGASVGGHPDAERVWARKDPGRWNRRTYGINANKAWHVASYRAEYSRWLDADRPQTEPFVSICKTAEEQVAFAKELKATLAQIGKPVPKPQPRDWDRGKAPRVEPIDEQPCVLTDSTQKALPEGVVDAEFTKLDDDEPILF